MSKTFDEGGAKGLLLVNLGTGHNGCNIVFDSKQGQEEETYEEEEEFMVDITSLTSKLDSIMGTELLENLELVPQLRTLRQEYAVLEEEGFITHEEKKVCVFCIRVFFYTMMNINLTLYSS
jgi:condensin complex subunit 2